MLKITKNFEINLGETRDLINLNSLRSVKLGRENF